MGDIHIICTIKLVQSVKEKETKGKKKSAILYAVIKASRGNRSPFFVLLFHSRYIPLVQYDIVCLFNQRGQHANSDKRATDKQRGSTDPQS